MLYPLGTTKNGIEVSVDLIHSQAAARVAQQPHLLSLVKEALQQITPRGPGVQIQHDMKRVIGYDFVIETTDKDTVFYARPLRDEVYSRFVKHGKPLSTQQLVICMNRRDNGEYELQDAWVGHISPPRPGSEDESPESRPYWANHAIIADNQTVQSSTITKTTPY